MAVKQIGVIVGGNIKRYIAFTTDNPSTYPTASDCGAGSTMRLINPSTHVVVGGLFFDGTNWNTV